MAPGENEFDTPDLHYQQKKSNADVYIAFANFHGVNNMAGFKHQLWYRWMWGWEKMCNVSFIYYTESNSEYSEYNRWKLPQE